MALPRIADVALSHLFTPYERMLQEGVPEVTANRIMRLRAAYDHWLAFPKKRDREIIAFLTSRYGVASSTAYEDLAIVKNLLGNLQKSSKDYNRYLVIQRLNTAYDLAYAKGDIKNMILATDRLAKYTQLDKEDERDADWDAIVPQRFIFTDNPEVLGFRRMSNVKERKAALMKKYFTEDVKEVDFEEIDFDQESLFKPNHVNADGTAKDRPAGIS
ncbi:hypothetical protein E4T81_05060 [Barnesiella sp. WM24]|uniref:hypothetical protein n=1 Tax=Barnesiella sp. WM24 TaxID=2558278 RepID=UPI0010729EA1|nr:hypothetical protein [Barnesiella sp. WM24]TFU93965.1 hypothetical protein E4T81_05060 [Barnesiella sp. WM24]